MKSQGSVGKWLIPELGQEVCERCWGPGSPRNLHQWGASGTHDLSLRVPRGQNLKYVSSRMSQVVSDCSPEETQRCTGACDHKPVTE